jgi:L-histidine N-alpha-methyltransferase
MPGWVARHRPRALVELGAGNAAKTRTILDAMRADGGAHLYVPVDISADFLERTAEALRAEYPGLEVRPVAADFTRHIDLGETPVRPALLTILGSTIGNFDPPEATALLRRVRAAMLPGDHFLLGVDLRKEVTALEAAYNDEAGVTAEFNLNLLEVLNREFGADFEPTAFEHRAIYDRDLHRIEMHLVSRREQTVRVPSVGDFRLAEGETIRTEISCKHDRASVEALFAGAGLRMEEWIEDAARRFALAVGVIDDRR